MKNVITAIKSTSMYLSILILGTAIVSFALKTLVWFLGLMLLDPVHALGYICLGVILVVGVSTAIDKFRDSE